MNKISPVSVPTSLAIGIMVFIASASSMFSSVKTSHQEPKIIPTSAKPDTPAIQFFSSFASTVDSISIDSNHIDSIQQKKLGKVNTDAYLNLNPNLFNWIIFHSVLIAFLVVFLVFFVRSALLDRTFKIPRMFLDWISKDSWVNKFLSSWIFKKGIVVSALLLLGFFWYLTCLPSINIWDSVKLLDIFIVDFKSSVVKNVLGVSLVIALVILLRIIWLLFGLENERKKENKTEKKELIYEATGHNQEHYYIFKVNNSIDQQKAKEIVNEINYYSIALSLLVSASIFGTAIQRKMICDLVKGIEHLYPYSFIFSYGLVFSFILALILIPSYIYIFDGEEAKDNKSKLETNIDFLKVIFAVLLPLITSFFNSFL